MIYPAETAQPDRDTVWVEDSGGPKELCVRWGPDPFMERGNFEGEKAASCEVYGRSAS